MILVIMYRAAVIFFVLGLVGMLMGQAGVARMSPSLGEIFLTLFLILSFITFLGGVISKKYKKDMIP